MRDCDEAMRFVIEIPDADLEEETRSAMEIGEGKWEELVVTGLGSYFNLSLGEHMFARTSLIRAYACIPISSY